MIEDESGTCSDFVHPHNGYFAGDFRRTEPLFTPMFARFRERVSARGTVPLMVTGVARVDNRTYPCAR